MRARLLMMPLMGVVLLRAAIIVAGEIHVPGDHGTIAEAMALAQTGDHVIVASGTYHESGLDYLGKGITVRSTDPTDPEVVAATVVDGDSAATIFRAERGEGPDAVLRGITVVRGRGGWGGGMVCVDSSPLIQGCVFRNNISTEDALGGGPYTVLEASPRSWRVPSNRTSPMMGGRSFSSVPPP